MFTDLSNLPPINYILQSSHIGHFGEFQICLKTTMKYQLLWQPLELIKKRSSSPIIF